MPEQGRVTPGTELRPIISFFKLTPEPHLVGSRCSCDAVFLDTRRVACSRCGATGPFEEIRLSKRGKVYVFSVVHQSFPGVKTPYITAIVDLPEGVSVRTNLLDVDPAAAEKEPNRLFDMPVEMTTWVAARDREGRDVVAFAFRPIEH